LPVYARRSRTPDRDAKSIGAIAGGVRYILALQSSDASPRPRADADLSAGSLEKRTRAP